MKAHKEKEYKMMINKDIYDYYLLNLDLKTFTQINYYYSCDNPLFAMRTRLINNKILFTLKEKKDEYKNEYEFEIEENNLNDSRIQKLLKEFNINNPIYEGTMKTTRSILDLKYGEFCLDKNEYLNKVDYEIEYELYDVENDIHDEFIEILNKANLVYERSFKSKYGRFKEAK